MGQVAIREGVDAADVSDVIIWGNHSASQYPDVRFAKVGDKGVSKEHEDYYRGDFVKLI